MADLTAALRKARTILAQSSADNSAEEDRAALWALLVGWDCEEDHEHTEGDPDCINSLDDVAGRWGWTPDQVAEIRAMRVSIKAAQERRLASGSTTLPAGSVVNVITKGPGPEIRYLPVWAERWIRG